MSDRRSGLLWRLAFVAVMLGLFPTALHAQSCGLDQTVPPGQVDAASSTRFLPAGGYGEISLLRKYTDSAVVHVFETDQPKPGAWKVVSEPPVISYKPAPEKDGDRFTPSNGSVVRFIVPNRKHSFWETRIFVVRVCDEKAGDVRPADAWATVSVQISPPIWSKVISAAVLAIFYVLFALAVSSVRAQKHPLAAKYPAFVPARVYGFFAHLNPVVLTANSFNRGSIQKLQVLLFTFLVSGMVFSLVLTLGYLTDLSVTVAMLLGISAVGAAVAQSATTNRDRLAFENWAWLVKKKVLPINEEDQTGPRLSDLVMTNREFDIYKLQTLIFSILVALALLLGGEQNLGSFTVPQTLLGILGLSQVVYVSGTLAAPASISDLDQALTRLREMESKLQTVVARNTDIDADGKLPSPLPDPPSPLPPLEERKGHAPNAMRLYANIADQVEIMLESTLGVSVARAQLEPALA
jgi:hypothetical protein